MTSNSADQQAQKKSANAFKTISEVARVLDVPQHVLRFWETKFTQIKPMKRAGGRRYYRPEDVELLSSIRQLLHADGYTIRGVQKMMREKGVKSVLVAAKGEAEKTDTSVIATGTVTVTATNKISESDKSELISIRDDLLKIRAELVGG